jgi:O-antigen ligase
MEKLKYRLYFMVFIFTIFSIFFALLNTARQRDFYYIAIYLGIVGLFLERKNINFKIFNIAYPIILLGITKLIWFFALEHHPDGYNMYSDQMNGGKKLVLGGILVFYLTKYSNYLSNVKYKEIIFYIVCIGFVFASSFAFWQSIHGMQRVEMGLDRSTNAAYIYSTFSILFIYLLYTQKKSAFYAISALVITISFVVIILTGTRAAIILHLFIITVMTVFYFKKIHFKSIFFVVFISIIVILSLYKNYIHPKIEQTYNEVSLYQEGQDNTSLGARFSMWTVGIKNFANAPLGQSMQSRFNFSDAYTATHPQYKSTMEFINVHLHDEMIETLSLQGIFGGVALLWFYLSISWVALRERNTPLLFTMNCLIAYGLSDVILLSSEAILFYVALIGVCGIKIPTTQNNA